MRFAENGYYIEKYVKCANCGVLIYGEGYAAADSDDDTVYCTHWCREWAEQKAAGVASPEVARDFDD
ncbi:MAG: hypothetical protein ACU85V_01020 [Gammaproteobacteria bacterium]